MNTTLRSLGSRVKPDRVILLVGFGLITLVGTVYASDLSLWSRLLLSAVLGGVGLELVDRAYQRGDLERVR